MEGITGGLADLLWPPRCTSCNERIVRTQSGGLADVFCPTCADSVLFAAHPWCTKCGLPFDAEGPDHLCTACTSDPPPFESARSLFLYGGAIADAIQRFKYNDKAALASPLGKLMVSLLNDHDDLSTHKFDAVIPMPLHPNKLQSRGYNQSALLGKHIASFLNIPMLATTLTRVRNTPNQAGLTRSERMENVKGAFALNRPQKIEDRRVLLFDDVITSTATIREAATTLVRAGCGQVSALSLARSTGLSF